MRIRPPVPGTAAARRERTGMERGGGGVERDGGATGPTPWASVPHCRPSCGVSTHLVDRLGVEAAVEGELVLQAGHRDGAAASGGASGRKLGKGSKREKQEWSAPPLCPLAAPSSHSSFALSRLFMVDLDLLDLDPFAPAPRLGSTVTFRPSTHPSGGWDVCTAGADQPLGRLPAGAAAPAGVSSASTGSVRSLRRAPEGGLAGVVVRVTAAAVATSAAPADDTGVRPVPRRRGESERRRGARARKRLKHDARLFLALTPRSLLHTRTRRPRPTRGGPGPGRPAVPPDQGGLRRAR